MCTGQFETNFGSLERYVKGEIEIINDDPRNYAFSNVFDVAAKSAPYEKVVVGKSCEYVIEVLRAAGTSEWFAASHDEFALLMDGVLVIELVKLDDPREAAEQSESGSVRLARRPAGAAMGTMRLRRGHQALLPAGAAYRFRADEEVGVIILQTILGPYSAQKWADICYA